MLSKSLFFIFLFISGFSSLINQVVWQRAIKIYLGGADAICSMIVVFVFMLGLGVGSLLISKKISSLEKPLHTLAKLELSLFITNLIVLIVLKYDVSSSVFAIQRAAILFGLPIKFLYAVTGFLLLIVPCSLMGMTMPVASEIAKKYLKFENAIVLDNMFFINTIGSCLGAVATGFKLLPFYGQTLCLIIAAIMNLSSSIICLYIDKLINLEIVKKVNNDNNEKKAENNSSEKSATKNNFIKEEEIATFFMGFVSLGYEMYLTRVIPLIYKPLPYTFSSILTLYLFSWAIGVSLSGYIKERINSSIMICTIIIWLSPFVVQNHRNMEFDLTFFPTTLFYSMPCLLFGIIYGQLLNRQLKNWGQDVGRFMGLNTIGSCLGILATTLIGGYMFFTYNAWIFAAILFLLVAWLELKDSNILFLKKYNKAIVIGLCITVMPVLYASIKNPVEESKRLCYSDPMGVTEITSTGNMIWDGLWHSQLTDGKRHIKQNNWILGVIPFLSISDSNNINALNIGMGIGITASVLSKSDLITKIKTYDINKSIDLILTDFATATLNLRTNPKIEIAWQDARTGLSLNEEEYSLITQQPLYLSQAGSSNLLSEEYLRVVSSRLKENGVFLVYANSLGNDAQKLLVEKTLKKVFPYCISFFNRYMYLVSKSPIIYTKESIQNKFDKYADDELIKEIKSVYTVDELYGLKDSENNKWEKCPLIISDDCPILEYPEELTKLSENWK